VFDGISASIGQQVQVQVKDRSVAIELLRDSVSTLAMKSV
jgi:hypothetical protein